VNREPTNAEKIRRLPWSIAFNAANSVFVQLTFFGSVFVLFLSELGLSKTQIGSLLSLFPFSGLIALFIAPAVARFGYKRAFLASWGARKTVAVFLLLTPWVLSHWDLQAALIYVVGVVTVFALCRAVSMTALYPWIQEYVPDTVRGKYSATNNIFSSLFAFLAVTGAGYVLGPSPDLDRFTVLFAVGVLFGFISLWMASFIPGGAPVEETAAERARRGGMLAATRDRSFVLYLVGAGLMTLASGPLVSFLPLFMGEQVGLSSGNVVLLQTGALLGTLLSSYLWGWAADRYGSTPVMSSGLFLQALLPLCWLLMPRQSVWSLYVALGVAFLQGLANMSWAIGSARLLYVSVVPPERKTEYMALYYAWLGIVGGLGQLIGGRVVDYSAGITGRFLIFTLDPYTLLFLASLVLPLVSGLLLRGVRADSAVTVREFAGMFFRGNPFLALESLIRYHLAKDERTTVTMTERLGQAKSPLTVEELLETLADPRFNVRFEAIVSIARHGPDERLMEALAQVLAGNEPALSVIAAWAMGRIGDRRALEPLRQGLEARYRSVQAHCARSLGTLGDVEVVPLLLERLGKETDEGLRMAYASALGMLGAEGATDQLLAFLRTSRDEDSRMELALALARVVGDEHYFIQLLRQVGVETGTATSQAITALKKRMGELQIGGDDLVAVMDDCAEALAREELERGVALMGRVIRLLPLEGLGETCAMVLQECAERLEEFGARRIEYVLLALHAMNAGVVQRHIAPSWPGTRRWSSP
jgi:MFS family permease